MEDKIWLTEGFCPVDGYHCLMPVAYEAEEKDGVIQRYHKKEMACRHAKSGKCSKGDDCAFFQGSPKTLEKNAMWHE